MSEAGLRTLLIGLTVVTAAVGGYVFGVGSGRSAERTIEAAQDLVIPVDDMRRDRIRRDAMRELAGEIAEFQAAFHRANGRYARGDSLGVSTHGYYVEWQNGGGFVISIMQEKGPYGEACAVAVGREPAYAAGIPLRRAGRVRCSWDLATRINRIMR